MLRLIIFKKTFLFSLLTLVELGLLSGCAQLSLVSEGESLSPEAVEMKSGFIQTHLSSPLEEVPTYAGMDAQTMYQLMIAEMLIVREQYQDAFDLMMPIAEQRQEVEISQRVFQLSMQTVNLVSMKRATALLKAVEPDKAVTWQAAYLLSLQDGQVEQAFKEWQQYWVLSRQQKKVLRSNAENNMTPESGEQSFEMVVLDTANRISQSVRPPHGLAFLALIKEHYPNEQVVAYALGAASLVYQNYDMALSNLWQAEQSYQNDENKLAVHEDIYIKLSQAYLGKSAYQEGLVKLASYAEQNPNAWRFQEQYARLEVKAELYDSAVKRYSMIVEQSPLAYTSRLSLALLLMEQKKYVQADALLNPLLNVPSFQAISLYYAGVSKKAQNQPEQALLFFQQITEGEFYIESQLQIAELLYPRIGLAKVLENLEALTPQTPEEQLKLYRAKAIFYKASNDNLKAIESYELALNIMPNNLDILFAQAVLFYEVGDYPQYEDRLNRILVIKPEQVDALNALGYFYVEQNKQLDKAELLLARAVEVAPDSYYVLDSQGWLRYVQARYGEAEVLLERAFALMIDEEVLIHLIKTKWQLNKFMEAQNLWQKYSSSFPANEQLQSLRDEIFKP